MAGAGVAGVAVVGAAAAGFSTAGVGVAGAGARGASAAGAGWGAAFGPGLGPGCGAALEPGADGAGVVVVVEDFSAVGGWGAAFFAGAFCSVAPAPAVAPAGGFSLILRTTGASMVELAVLTNSPCSFR